MSLHFTIEILKTNQLVKKSLQKLTLCYFKPWCGQKGVGYLLSFSSPDCWDMYRGPLSSMGSRANVNLAFSYAAILFPFEPFIIFSFLSPPRLSPYHKPQKHFSYSHSSVIEALCICLRVPWKRINFSWHTVSHGCKQP